MPGSIPATRQLDWLISTTAMIVLSWSRATRDLLKACPSEGRGRSAGASGHSISWLQRRWCHLLAACPIPSLRWREMDSNRRYPANFFGGPFDPHAIRRPQYEPARLATGSNPSLSSKESRVNLWPADHAQVKPDRKHLERVSRAPGGRAGVGAGSRARSWRGSG